MSRSIAEILLSAEQYAQLTYLATNTSTTLYKQYRAASNFSTTEIALYVEGYVKVLYQRLILREAQGVYYILTGIAGILGYILAILVLRSSSFKTPSFVYHKFLCGYLLPAMFITVAYGICFILAPLYPNAVYGCLLSWFPRITILFTNVADLLTLCIALDRAVAVWLPRHYYLINEHSIATYICSSLMIFNGIELPQFFSEYIVETPGKACLRPSTAFGLSDTYAVITTVESWYGLIRGYAILLVSLLVIGGVAKLAIRKRKQVVPGIGVPTIQSKELEKMNKQLYRLSCACSVPIFVSVIIYFIYRQLGTGFITGLDGVKLSSFAEAQRHLDWRTTYLIWQLVNNMADLFGHFPYFYFYVMFSSTFRRATITFIAHKRGITSAVTGFSQNTHILVAPRNNSTRM